VDEKTLRQALDRACAELANAAGCPLGSVDWGPQDCLGPDVCDGLLVRDARRACCWKAFCAGRDRVAEEADRG